MTTPLVRPPSQPPLTTVMPPGQVAVDVARSHEPPPDAHKVCVGPVESTTRAPENVPAAPVAPCAPTWPARPCFPRSCLSTLGLICDVLVMKYLLAARPTPPSEKNRATSEMTRGRTGVSRRHLRVVVRRGYSASRGRARAAPGRPPIGDRPGVLKVPPDSVARSGARTEAVRAGVDGVASRRQRAEPDLSGAGEPGAGDRDDRAARCRTRRRRDPRDRRCALMCRSTRRR
jgi:hypothetical protein